jgi:hypothetical protein
VAGLLVFGVYSTFSDASEAAADEASNLVLMYYNAEAFPQPERGQAQQAITDYTRSVIEDDWPALADGKGSPKTDQALDRMYKVWAPMEPSAQWSDEYTASVDELNTVLTLRNQRIDDSGSALHPIYWVLLFVGAFLTILHLVLLHMENLTMHLIAVGVTAAMMGMVLFLLIEVNAPFRGEIAVSSSNFRAALTSITTAGG